MIQEMIKVSDDLEKIIDKLFDVLLDFMTMCLDISKGVDNPPKRKLLENDTSKRLIKLYKKSWETGEKRKQSYIIDNVIKNNPNRALLFSTEILGYRDEKLEAIISKNPNLWNTYESRLKLIESNKLHNIDDNILSFLGNPKNYEKSKSGLNQKSNNLHSSVEYPKKEAKSYVYLKDNDNLDEVEKLNQNSNSLRI